ncbi:MAG: DNA-binding response regulator [Acidobacteria bacterium]|nr:MAG: DNA-binding response regulator [Acidobacteriota bacterium]
MIDTVGRSIRIVIIDDHVMVRAGLRMLIEQDPRLLVVGEAGDLAMAVPLTARTQPDVILLDLDMAGQNGLDILPDLQAAATQAHVLVLTGVRDPAAHRDAVRRGALGVLLKDHAANILLKAIHKVQAGEVWLDRVAMAHVLADLRTTPAPQDSDPEQEKVTALSDREREVLDLVVQGLKNREIGDRLFISDHTVRHHVAAIFAKLGVSSRLELILYAYRHHLAKTPGVLT